MPKNSIVYKAKDMSTFTTAVNNSEYIIDFQGPDAQKAISKMNQQKRINLGGKVLIGAFILALTAGSGGVGGFIAAGAGGASIILTKNMKKYDVDILAEDHAVFILKDRYKNKKINKTFKNK